MSQSTISFRVPRSISYFDAHTLAVNDDCDERGYDEFVPSPVNNTLQDSICLATSLLSSDFEEKALLKLSTSSEHNEQNNHEMSTASSSSLVEAKLSQSHILRFNDHKHLSQDTPSERIILPKSRSAMYTNDYCTPTYSTAPFFESAFSAVSSCQFQEDDALPGSDIFIPTCTNSMMYSAHSGKGAMNLPLMKEHQYSPSNIMVKNSMNENVPAQFVDLTNDAKNEFVSETSVLKKQSGLYPSIQQIYKHNLSNIPGKNYAHPSLPDTHHEKDLKGRPLAVLENESNKVFMQQCVDSKNVANQMFYDLNHNWNENNNAAHQNMKDVQPMYENSPVRSEQRAYLSQKQNHVEPFPHDLNDINHLAQRMTPWNTHTITKEAISSQSFRNAQIAANRLSNYKTQELLLALTNAHNSLGSAHKVLTYMLNTIPEVHSNHMDFEASNKQNAQDKFKPFVSQLSSFIESLVSTLHSISPEFFGDNDAKDDIILGRHQIILAHPDEFRNPSSFLKVYGDPQCSFDRRDNTLGTNEHPYKDKNGNWECSECHNINYPRRFRCNNHGCRSLRGLEGDRVVSEYTRQVFYTYLVDYSQHQTSNNPSQLFTQDLNSQQKFKVENNCKNDVKKYAGESAYLNKVHHTHRDYNRENSSNGNDCHLLYKYMSNSERFKKPNQVLFGVNEREKNISTGQRLPRHKMDHHPQSLKRTVLPIVSGPQFPLPYSPHVYPMNNCFPMRYNRHKGAQTTPTQTPHHYPANRMWNHSRMQLPNVLGK